MVFSRIGQIPELVLGSLSILESSGLLRSEVTLSFIWNTTQSHNFQLARKSMTCFLKGWLLTYCWCRKSMPMGEKITSPGKNLWIIWMEVMVILLHFFLTINYKRKMFSTLSICNRHPVVHICLSIISPKFEPPKQNPYVNPKFLNCMSPKVKDVPWSCSCFKDQFSTPF